MTITSYPRPLEERVARLEAQEDPRRLAHEYCRGLDRGASERFAAIWADDAVWVLGDEVAPSRPT